MNKLINNIETEWNLRERFSTSIDLSKLIFIIVFVCHIFGSLFFYIGKE